MMLDEGSAGLVRTQFCTFAEPPNEMRLESGRKLGPITLAYETYGTLDASASNAILILHGLSGDAHAAGYHREEDKRLGWWDSMVGPGKPFNTDKYYVICSNVIGGCCGSTGPSSINPETGASYGLAFPVVTIGDMVRAQKALIEHLSIETLLSVCGGSMGGMQALEWAVRYPESVDSAMIIASTHVSSAQGIAFDAVGRHAITSDEAFSEGNYYDRTSPARGLAVARMLAHITYLSDASIDTKFGRRLRTRKELGYNLEKEFEVETYLEHQGKTFVDRFDANSYLYITKAIDYFNLAEKYGSLEKAMELVKSRMLVAAFSSDWLYPPSESEKIVHALVTEKKDVSYCNIESSYGHDAFLLEAESLGNLVSGFIANARDSSHVCEDVVKATVLSPEQPKPNISGSIYDIHRVDHDMIISLIEEGSRVLDIGCGNGELLCKLLHKKEAKCVGIELNQKDVSACVHRGISVIQADVDQGLAAFPDHSIDYVILSMTMQVLDNPALLLKEMVRVGKKCLISFPNFGFWRIRASLALTGRAPVTRALPYSWYDTPNRHVVSIKDFRTFCANQGARVEREIPLSSRGTAWSARLWPNLFADEAVYVVTLDNKS
ncbi:homoserine O-acetyltransferase [Candidatus Hydrogenedentota bacterium]